MNEIPNDDGSSSFEVSDSNLGIKKLNEPEGNSTPIGDTWYKDGEWQS